MIANSRIISKRENILHGLRLVEPLQTFGNFNKVPGTEVSYKAFLNIANGIKPMLLCFGSPGCGKTHLMRATILRLYGRGIYCRYLEWYKMIQTLKTGLDKDAIPTYEKILENYCLADALAVDDYGLGTGNTVWEKSQFEIIVNFRYDRRLLTMVTTNLPLAEVPDRVKSRFRDPDIGQMVVNRGKDYRRLKNEMPNK